MVDAMAHSKIPTLPEFLDCTDFDESSRHATIKTQTKRYKYANGCVILSEIAYMPKILLRGRIEDQAFYTKMKTVLGHDLPKQVKQSLEIVATENNPIDCAPISIITLSFDEWLILCRHSERAQSQHSQLLTTLHTQLAGQFFQACDVSDGRVLLHLQGSAARHLLEKGCALDLHDRFFPNGATATSLLAGMDVLIYRRDQNQEGVNYLGYEILIARSFAQHLWDWLVEAGREYGRSELDP